MWRLKIAEGGIDPNIYSTNNFLGRQTWEFDPDAGTLEERAEIEEARQNFWKNRNVVKPSSDLLWRFQFLREKKFKQTIPQPCRLAMAIGVLKILARCSISLPWFFSLYITGHLNAIFSAEHKKKSYVTYTVTRMKMVGGDYT
ncbi:hypothetical protein OIU77_022542 [Salix suchowensis]|uniref:Beta-amyrin synthase n=1 Tax=Salix suchowensis TaxID=1278906 RepID=A0ABQ9C486_9ROSI|nr:hypothetical protein OIU77_022542 [Salix suchowensis]